ncbi:MAG: hypothetical protein M1816_007414 [Peltula sp. TS41687]|nr:MAG: hypothetical protein M1816_007414 [Peltula sp. TS41687]
MPIAIATDIPTNPAPLRYRKRRHRQKLTEACSFVELTPRGHPRPVTTFGVPAEWTRFHDMLLWSFRGNTKAVHAQLQKIYRFSPSISRDWVRLRLRDTVFHHLIFLEKYLPGEAGTLHRVKIRAAVLNGGHDFFHEGSPDDETPEPGSSTYHQPPLPPDAPANWSRNCDIFLYRALMDGEHPRDIYGILKKTMNHDLKGLRRSWLELRMAQSGHLGIEVRNQLRNARSTQYRDSSSDSGRYAQKWLEDADRRCCS